jgi:hypothetical protein
VIPTRDIKLGGYTVGQTPNGPALVATGAGFVARGSTNPRTRGVAAGLYFAALAVWGWLELTDGVNLPRRIMGAVTLGYVAFEVATRAGLTDSAKSGPDAAAEEEAGVPGVPHVPG